MDSVIESIVRLKSRDISNADSCYNRSPLWKKKTGLKRHRVFWAAVILMAIVSVGICDKDIKTGGESENVCTTTGCVAASKLIQRNMDKKANPCDNFYQFACGGFKKNARIPEGKASITTFTKTEELLDNQLKSILTKPSNPEEIRPYKLAKQFYASCMDKERIEKVGLTPLILLLIRLGGWPLQDRDWNEHEFNWQQTIARFRKEGLSVSYLIDFMIDSDLKNSSSQVIELDEPSLELDREELLKGIKDDGNVKYLEFMVDIAVLFGSDLNHTRREQRQVLNFEIDLAKITTPEHERQDYSKLHNPMKISELQRKHSSINWLEYINNILAPCQKVDDSEVIVISNPQFIAGLETLIQRTPKRILANYLMWRVVESSANFLTEFLKIRQQELNITDNRPEARWRECVDIVSDRFQLAVGSMYVKNHFKPQSKEKAQEMVTNIRQEMYETINSVDWMNEVTKKTALNKAHNLINLVGYPEEVLDDKELIKHYEKLEINPDEFFLSALNLTKFETNYVFSKLKEPFERGDWVEYGDIDSVDVIYYDWTNTLQISAAVLQPPFFYPDGPRYLDYGSSGYLTAFQMTHAFDDHGCNHDEEGNLAAWWDESTKKQFSDKAQCFVDQYGNYTVEELGGTKLSGMNTQSENIADNGAAKIAYRAYQKWASKNPIEAKLPDLQNFTIPQMFWLSVANTWCANYNNEDLMSRLTSDDFAPGEFRVIGTFSNQKEFAKDFRCPAGSNMNPIKKCQVW